MIENIFGERYPFTSKDERAGATEAAVWIRETLERDGIIIWDGLDPAVRKSTLVADAVRAVLPHVSGMTLEEVFTKDRRYGKLLYRYFTYRIFDRLAFCSMREMNESLGVRINHSTIINGRRVVEDILRTDPSARSSYSRYLAAVIGYMEIITEQ